MISVGTFHLDWLPLYLDDFGHAIDELSGRQAVQKFEINVYLGRLPKRADEILPSGSINGCLTAD